MSELGDLLRKLRGKESLRDVHKRSGVSHNYLSIVEKGIDPRTGSPVQPTSDTLKKLAKAYRYPYEELLRVAGILEEGTEYTVSRSVSEMIIKDIVEKYNVDLSVEGNREKLEKIIQIVVNDFERNSQQ